jgi:hypothetical protein
METSPNNPIIVALMLMLRCLIPLLVMLGISYLLRRLGVIVPPPAEPEADQDDAETPPSQAE